MSCSSLWTEERGEERRGEERRGGLRLKVRGVEYECGEKISEINTVVLTEDYRDKLRLPEDEEL